MSIGASELHFIGFGLPIPLYPPSLTWMGDKYRKKGVRKGFAPCALPFFEQIGDESNDILLFN